MSCSLAKITIICLRQLIYNITACVKNIRRARHFVNDCVNDTLQCCDKRVAGTVAIYCADMMSNDVSGTQKKRIKFK